MRGNRLYIHAVRNKNNSSKYQVIPVVWGEAWTYTSILTRIEMSTISVFLECIISIPLLALSGIFLDLQCAEYMLCSRYSWYCMHHHLMVSFSFAVGVVLFVGSPYQGCEGDNVRICLQLSGNNWYILEDEIIFILNSSDESKF